MGNDMGVGYDAAAEQEAAQLAAQFEGFSATPYLDILAKPPVWTIGFGSTRLMNGQPVTADTPPISWHDGVALMGNELRQAFHVIAATVQQPLSVDQKAALADFIYNVGQGNFISSSLYRKLNEGDWEGAAAEFERWDQAGGHVLAGLLRRRKAEEQLFRTPDQPIGSDLGGGVTSAATFDDIKAL